MKLEAALITNNSPYAEVRAVVENTDDPTTPCSTVRAWTIGLFFSVILALINQLFSIRQPAILVDANVAQLLSYPIGKAWERFMPDWRFTLFGVQHSLNPGPFNKKEHMLIAIMANVAQSIPYTQYIIWTQVLPQVSRCSRSFRWHSMHERNYTLCGHDLGCKFIFPPQHRFLYCRPPSSQQR